MAQNTVVKVVVEELTKYGFKANGRYVNFSKQISEGDKAKVVPGATFDAEYYVADSGKEYLNKIVAISPTPSAPVVDVARAKKFTPSFKKKEAPSNAMSKADWEAKDRSMMIGGLSHDAAVVCAALVNVNGESFLGAMEAYKGLLEEMLKIREEVK